MSEQREALAEALWLEFTRSTPERFWDAAFWQDNGWTAGSLDVADRKRIVLGVLTSGTLDLLADAEQRRAASRVSRSEVERALRAADAPEDSMATEEDLIRYEGRAEAVEIMRDMLSAALATGAADRVRAEACGSVLALRYGSAACDLPSGHQGEHRQHVSGRIWTTEDADKAQAEASA